MFCDIAIDLISSVEIQSLIKVEVLCISVRRKGPVIPGRGGTQRCAPTTTKIPRIDPVSYDGSVKDVHESGRGGCESR